jgi:hypothetical protein
MSIFKLLLVTPVTVAMTILPSLAAAPASPANDCMAPKAFLTALSTAGDWIVKRDPAGNDEKLTGVVFRDAGMFNVALFKDGCLAMVVIVGKAPPDREV